MQRKEYAENWFRLCKETGINFVRLHAMPYPQFFLDAADELGMLICSESAIYGSSKATQSDDPIFLDRCREHFKQPGAARPQPPQCDHLEYAK